MKKTITLDIDEYLEMKRECNYQKTLNAKMTELINVQNLFIENQEGLMQIYVKRLKEYADMLASRETTLHEIVDSMIIKDRLQLMQNFIGEIPNKLN